MDRNPMRDFIVGLFVVAGIAALAYLSVSIGGFRVGSRPTLNLTAAFDETGDLHVRAPVVIAGVRVGEVSSISLDPNFRARVNMSLNSDLKLPVDTSAAIVTAGVLGDRYIELSPGSEDEILKSGGSITSTESAIVFERLIGKLIYHLSGGDSEKAPATTGPAKGS